MEGQFYIGCGQTKARPEERDGQAGYVVTTPSNREFWCPKGVFEVMYLPMGEGSDGTAINQAMVDDFISEYRVSTVKLIRPRQRSLSLCSGMDLRLSSHRRRLTQ
jgi:hypothetical protein